MPGQAAAPAPTLGLQVSPYKVAGKPGQHNVGAAVTVTNTTGHAETVHAQFVALSKVPGGCSASAPPSWVHASPATFRLGPHGHHVTTLTAHAPGSAGGFYDLAAVFRASAPMGSGHSGLAVSAGIATRLQVNLAGHPVTEAHCTRTAAAPPKAAAHAANGIPWPGLVIAVLILACIGYGVHSTRKRHKRSYKP